MNSTIIFLKRFSFFNHLFDVFDIRPHFEIPAFLNPTKDQEQQVLNLAQLLLKLKELQDQTDIVKPKNASLGHPTMERSLWGNYILSWKNASQKLDITYQDDGSLCFIYKDDNGEQGLGGMKGGAYTALNYIWRINNSVKQCESDK
jgi:hypothetical protein